MHQIECMKNLPAYEKAGIQIFCPSKLGTSANVLMQLVLMAARMSSTEMKPSIRAVVSELTVILTLFVLPWIMTTCAVSWLRQDICWIGGEPPSVHQILPGRLGSSTWGGSLELLCLDPAKNHSSILCALRHWHWGVDEVIQNKQWMIESSVTLLQMHLLTQQVWFNDFKSKFNCVPQFKQLRPSQPLWAPKGLF